MGDGRAFSFANKLAVWLQQTAQEPTDAKQADEKRDDEAGQQQRSIDERGTRRHREDRENQDGAHQKYSGKNGQPDLKTTTGHVSVTELRCVPLHDSRSQQKRDDCANSQENAERQHHLQISAATRHHRYTYQRARKYREQNC